MKFPQPNGLRIALLTFIICSQASFAFAQIIDPENSPLDCATYIAQRLNPDELSVDGPKIAQINWELGHPERVLNLIKQTPCQRRAYSANSFAKLELENKNFENANNYVQEILSCHTEENSIENYLLVEAVAYYARLKKFDKAFSVLKMIEDDPAYLAIGLISIAEEKIIAGESIEAELLLHRALSEARQGHESERTRTIRSFNQIAVLYTKLGNKSATLSTLEEPLTIAEKEEDTDNLKSTIVIAYAKCDLFMEAEQLANKLSKSDNLYTLLWLAKHNPDPAKSNKVSGVLQEITRKIDTSEDDEYSKSSAYNSIVKAYLEELHPLKAIQIAQKISDAYYRCDAAKSIAKSCFEQKKNELAIEAIDNAFANIRQIISEKSEDIQSHANTSNALQKSQYLSQLADLYLQANQYEKALECAKAIDQPQYRANKFADVAAAMRVISKNSKSDKLLLAALKLSETAPYYSHDRQQDSTLLNIARRLAETGNRTESLKIFTSFLKKERHHRSSLADLAEIGSSFELGGLQPNKEIQLLLREIAKDWLKE